MFAEVSFSVLNQSKLLGLIVKQERNGYHGHWKDLAGGQTTNLPVQGETFYHKTSASSVLHRGSHLWLIFVCFNLITFCSCKNQHLASSCFHRPTRPDNFRRSSILVVVVFFCYAKLMHRGCCLSWCLKFNSFGLTPQQTNNRKPVIAQDEITTNSWTLVFVYK